MLIIWILYFMDNDDKKYAVEKKNSGKVSYLFILYCIHAHGIVHRIFIIVYPRLFCKKIYSEERPKQRDEPLLPSYIHVLYIFLYARWISKRTFALVSRHQLFHRIHHPLRHHISTPCYAYTYIYIRTVTIITY